MTRPVWIDIENPPQVQYLAPFLTAFSEIGADTLVTARDYGITVELLRARGIEARVYGGGSARGRAAKAAVVLGRSARLLPPVARRRPLASLSASRAAAIVSRALRVPSWVIIDYEHVDLGLFRRLGSNLLHPDAIDAAAFTAQGWPPERLHAFAGIKEDLTFAYSNGRPVDAYELAAPPDAVRVLIRPPAERSHYYVDESGALAGRLLDHLATRPDCVVVFSPRYPWQVEQLQGRHWANEPIVLERGVPFLPLLHAVDAVVSSGGTMLREAAYLGVPAYSIFRGTIGAVDRALERQGRLRVIDSADRFPEIELKKRDAGLGGGDPGVVRAIARQVAFSEPPGMSRRMSDLPHRPAHRGS